LGQLRLGGKGAGWGDARLQTPRGRVEPFLGDVEFPVHDGTARRTGIGQKDADLLILPATRGAAILAGHAGRLGTFLQEARLIDDENAAGLTQVVDHVPTEFVTHRVSVPFGLSQQALDAAWVPFAALFGELLPILAFCRAKQSRQLRARVSLRPKHGAMRR